MPLNTEELIPHKINSQQKYSDEYLLNHLKELAILHGKSPSRHYIKKAGKVSSYLYFIRFGSLTKAQKAAGLVPNKRGPQQKYSNEYLINHLVELSKKLGRTPTMSDIKKAGKVSGSAYNSSFGSISNAQKEAGLVPNKRGHQQKYSNKYLLNHLKKLSKQLGRTPTMSDIEKAGKVSIQTYFERFGSFSKAQKTAGLIPNKRGNQQKYSNEYLINHLVELSKKLGRTPTGRDITEQGKASESNYIYHFGSLGKALKTAGLVPNKRGIFRSGIYLFRLQSETEDIIQKVMMR